jgi:hypothetical protein
MTKFGGVTQKRKSPLHVLLAGLLLYCSTSAAQYVPSPDIHITDDCSTRLAPDRGPYQPVTMNKGANQLFNHTAMKRWELDDYGGIYRHSTLGLSETEDLLVEEYNPALDMGPSRMWIQTLQNLGQMPQIPSHATWSQIDRYMDQNDLHEFSHPHRLNHLTASRNQYASALSPGFEFALSQYPRRAWFTPEFEKGARDTFNKTLRTASYIFLRSKKTKRIVAAIRLIRVHNGLLRLKHVSSGRTLEILGNAEIGWGVDGKLHLGWEPLKATFQVEKFAKEFLASKDAVVKRVSGFEPIEMVKLPMETGLGIDLPRDYQDVDLRGQHGFGPEARVTILGQPFEVSFSHAVLVEPGLFAIEKSEKRADMFVELSIWLGKYLSIPRLPEWVDEKRIGYWTYNDLPLYKMFGFSTDEAFPEIHKYGVDWDIYKASPEKIHLALQKLAQARSTNSGRANQLNYFLREMGQRGF